MIISLSVVLHYIHYCHPNLKNVVNIQGHVCLQTLCICQKYTSIITVMAIYLFRKTQGSQPKCSEQKVWGKIKFTYMKHIKIQSWHMGVIFTPKHMTRQRETCVHTHSQITRYNTGNVYCNVVPNVQVLIFLTSK